MSPDFWDDSDKAQNVMATLSDKKEDLKAYTDIEEAIKDNQDLIDLVELSDDEELSTLEEVDSNLKKSKKT